MIEETLNKMNKELENVIIMERLENNEINFDNFTPLELKKMLIISFKYKCIYERIKTFLDNEIENKKLDINDVRT